MKYNKKYGCNMDMFDVLLNVVLISLCVYSLYYVYTYSKTNEQFIDMDRFDKGYSNINNNVRYNFNNFNENKGIPDLVLTNKTGGFMISVDYTKSDYTNDVVWIENDRSYNFNDMLIDENKNISVDISVYKAYYIRKSFNLRVNGTYKINIDSNNYQSLIASVNDL